MNSFFYVAHHSFDYVKPVLYLPLLLVDPIADAYTSQACTSQLAVETWYLSTALVVRGALPGLLALVDSLI